MKKEKAVTETRSIVFYDGECGLCEKSVRMVWKADPEGIFYFASLQSEFAHKFLYKNHGITEVSLNTMYLHHEGKLFERSEAVMEVGKRLEGGLLRRASWLLRNCPSKALTDSLYNLVARNRHVWGKKSDVCEVPPQSVQKRFLDC